MASTVTILVLCIVGLATAQPVYFDSSAVQDWIKADSSNSDRCVILNCAVQGSTGWNMEYFKAGSKITATGGNFIGMSDGSLRICNQGNVNTIIGNYRCEVRSGDNSYSAYRDITVTRSDFERLTEARTNNNNGGENLRTWVRINSFRKSVSSSSDSCKVLVCVGEGYRTPITYSFLVDGQSGPLSSIYMSGNMILDCRVPAVSSVYTCVARNQDGDQVTRTYQESVIAPAPVDRCPGQLAAAQRTIRTLQSQLAGQTQSRLNEARMASMQRDLDDCNRKVDSAKRALECV